MRDDPEEATLEAMARLLREEAASEDARLDQLAQGTLDAATRASLEADAAHDPGLAADMELHLPLSEPVQAQLRSIARAGLNQPEELDEEVGSAPAVKAKVKPWWRRRRSLWAFAPSLALAASLAAVLIAPQLSPPPPPLPTYAFLAQAGDATKRGPDDVPDKVDRRTVREDSEVSLVMRSSDVVEATGVRAVLFVLDADGAHQLPIEPTERNGAFLFRGDAAELTGGRRGALDLVMRVEREGLNLSPPPDAAPRSGQGWFSQGVSLDVTARP